MARDSEQLEVRMIAGQLCIVDSEPQAGGWPEPPTPTKLELIAFERGVDPDLFREQLRAEVDRRSRERAARHALAHRRLDNRIARTAD